MLHDVLSVASLQGVGRVLVDGDGKVLYLYVPDRQHLSRCTGSCAVQWPPLLAAPRQHLGLGPGVRRSLVGWVTRADGARQLTYNGWPLYSYRLDAPGSASGEEDDMGLWQAVSPKGQGVG